MRNRVFSMLLLVVALVGLPACASTGPPLNVGEQLTNTIAATCEFYREARPTVVEYREWAVLNWDTKLVLPDGSEVALVPERLKPRLKKLDEYLPKLDASGQVFCDARDGISAARASPGFDFDDAISIVLKVATTAIQLKQSGVF